MGLHCLQFQLILHHLWCLECPKDLEFPDLLWFLDPPEGQHRLDFPWFPEDPQDPQDQLVLSDHLVLETQQIQVIHLFLLVQQDLEGQQILPALVVLVLH